MQLMQITLVEVSDKIGGLKPRVRQNFFKPMSTRYLLASDLATGKKSMESNLIAIHEALLSRASSFDSVQCKLTAYHRNDKSQPLR